CVTISQDRAAATMAPTSRTATARTRSPFGDGARPRRARRRRASTASTRATRTPRARASSRSTRSSFFRTETLLACRDLAVAARLLTRACARIGERHARRARRAIEDDAPARGAAREAAQVLDHVPRGLARIERSVVVLVDERPDPELAVV